LFHSIKGTRGNWEIPNYWKGLRPSERGSKRTAKRILCEREKNGHRTAQKSSGADTNEVARSSKQILEHCKMVDLGEGKKKDEQSS